MTISQWDQYDMEGKVTAILSSNRYDKQPAFGTMYPFMSAYQIAIEFAQRYPETANALGHKIGGMGIGDRFSLTTYIASEVSRRIQKGQISLIEGGWLSAKHLKQIEFSHNGESIIGSTTYPIDFSIFRYCGDD